MTIMTTDGAEARGETSDADTDMTTGMIMTETPDLACTISLFAGRQEDRTVRRRETCTDI